MTLLMLAFLSPATSMTIAAKRTPSHNTMPAVVIPAKKPTETRKLLVDLTDAPLYEEASKLWSCDPFEPHRSPMGSIVFSLVDEGDVELTVATVYASLGLPSDDLEAQHADLLTSPCTLELLDIETAAAHRRHAARRRTSPLSESYPELVAAQQERPRHHAYARDAPLARHQLWPRGAGIVRS